MMERLDLDAIRRAYPLPGIVGATVKLIHTGKEYKACCPFHEERSPSFTIFDGGQRFYCFGCGASGDVFDYLARLHGVGLRDAAGMLTGGNLPKVSLPPMSPAADRCERIDDAVAIAAKAIPVDGTVGEQYLRFRGFAPPYPRDIRFAHLPCDNLGPLPCVVAVMRDVAGVVTGVQRIWIANDGRGKAAVDKPKRSLGRVKGSAIRLGELEGSGTVTICEGPETGLALLEMLGGPVWVGAGSTFLPHMQFPNEVTSTVIGADNDPAGEAAAQKAAQSFSERGLTVRIIRPLATFGDFADELQGAK